MAMRLNPYLSSRTTPGRRWSTIGTSSALSSRVSTFGDFGQAGTPIENLIMHFQPETPDGFTLMGSDTPPGMERRPGNSVSIVISGEDEEALRGFWEGLCDGATVAVPLERQMWGDLFAMCTDRFGTVWQVDISPAGG